MKTFLVCVIQMFGVWMAAPSQTSAATNSGSVLSRPLDLENQQRIEQKKLLIKSRAEVWARATFHSIGSQGFETNLSRRIVWNGLELPEGQQEQLVSKVTDFFHAFYSPSFDSYLRFRTNGYVHTLDPTNHLEKFIAYHTKRSRVHFPADPYGCAQTAWDVINSTNRLGERPRIVSIDLDNLRTTVRFETNSEFSLSARALELLDSTVRVATGGGVVTYSETPEKLFREYGYIQMAMIQAIVRFNTTDSPGYILIALYWSDADNQWIPWQLASDASSKFKVLF